MQNSDENTFVKKWKDRQKNESISQLFSCQILQKIGSLQTKNSASLRNTTKDFDWDAH